MRPFKLSADCVPEVKDDGFEYNQSLYPLDEKDHIWWLPPKELAYQFWKDYFAFCADAGISFAKIDDQSFSSFLAGVEGAEEAFALWDGMTRAADDVFGVGRLFIAWPIWAEYHAVLRAFFPGPVLLSDKAGEHDLRVIHKLIAKTTTGRYELVKSHQPAEPLSSRIWEPSLDSGIGPAIKAGSYFPAAHSSSLVMWSSRDGAASPSTDVLLPSDFLDLLGAHILESTKYALWFSEMQKMITFPDTSGLRPAIPLAEITLQPEGHEIIVVAPFHKVGDIEIAPLGLPNKYTGLAAIADTKVGDEALDLSILFEGKLGFIVTDSSRIKVSVNCQQVAFSSTVLSPSATPVVVDLGGLMHVIK
ncbi:hypothetical protein V1519DRAFT_500328 [Lipomyces tetrasporus]